MSLIREIINYFRKSVPFSPVLLGLCGYASGCRPGADVCDHKKYMINERERKVAFAADVNTGRMQGDGRGWRGVPGISRGKRSGLGDSELVTRSRGPFSAHVFISAFQQAGSSFIPNAIR